MKKILFITLLFFTIGTLQKAHAVVIYHNGNTFVTTEKLPADEVVNGQHVNFGVAFEQFGLFWLPLWNYGEVKYALISDNEENAWILADDEVAHLKEEYNLQIAAMPSIPLWHQIGLKPVILLLIIFIIWSEVSKRRKSEDDDISQNQSTLT